MHDASAVQEFNLNIYEASPKTVRNGIPVFSEEDDYIKNYARISSDHIASFERHGTNPFIPEELWKESEASTRSLLARFLPKGAKLLDVGVGLGRLIGPLKDVSKYGMDISFDYLEVARKNQIEVCFSRVEDMPYRKEMFDGISCTDVLEHVMDVNQCCQKVLSVLKPNGVLVVRVPYKEDLSGYLSETYPYQYAHLRSFDESGLRLLFEKIFKCKVLTWETAGYMPNPARIRYPLPKGNINVARLVNATSYVNRALYRRLSRMLFRPVEINVVIQKPA